MKLKKKSNAVRIPPVKKVIKVRRKSSDIEGETTVSKALKNVRKVIESVGILAGVAVWVTKFHRKFCSIPQNKNIDSIKKVPTLRVKSHRKKPIKKITKKTVRERTRGLVYVGHIPHGFYEEQMKDYFKQFGKVTRVRVSRSKNTGKSRGYGYVEFENSDVANIAAETMNNYLMCGRLLKAIYVPPEKQHRRFFAGAPWSSEVYPKLINRNVTNELKNTSTKSHKRVVQSTQDKLSALEQRLKSMGVDLTFATNDAEA